MMWDPFPTQATSALDSITERNIQKSLDELSEGRITLVVAHRLTTIRKADVVRRPDTLTVAPKWIFSTANT